MWWNFHWFSNPRGYCYLWKLSTSKPIEYFCCYPFKVYGENEINYDSFKKENSSYFNEKFKT